jgi:hypothetical protein
VRCAARADERQDTPFVTIVRTMLSRFQRASPTSRSVTSGPRSTRPGRTGRSGRSGRRFRPRSSTASPSPTSPSPTRPSPPTRRTRTSTGLHGALGRPTPCVQGRPTGTVGRQIDACRWVPPLGDYRLRHPGVCGGSVRSTRRSPPVPLQSASAVGMVLGDIASESISRPHLSSARPVDVERPLPGGRGRSWLAPGLRRGRSDLAELL